MRAANHLAAIEEAFKDANAHRPDPGLLVDGEPMTPLRELSLLLGVELVDVWRSDTQRGRTWYLVFAAYPTAAMPFRSYHFRTADKLNEWTYFRGRDPSLPRLTPDDGRRALSLMHAHVESKTDKTNTEETS